MKGILVNYEYCTGCHSCEVACKKILDLPEGEYGIKLTEVLPYSYEGATGTDKWEWIYNPVLTKKCDMCADRTAKGKFPMCVQHCQAWCMYYGELEDLVKKMDDGTRWSLMTMREPDVACQERRKKETAGVKIDETASKDGIPGAAAQEKIADAGMDL